MEWVNTGSQVEGAEAGYNSRGTAWDSPTCHAGGPGLAARSTFNSS